MIGFFLGTLTEGNGFNGRLLLLVVACMVFARSAAMAFNRYLDRDIDAQNPRTVVREIPAGIIAPSAALAFVIGNCICFVLATYLINPLCFALSPVALLVILGYSFTSWCHLVLGLGLSLAPIGAYLAVTGVFSLLPVLYSCVVLLWVSGFDIIYALQDEQFDQSKNLHSIPVALGGKNALRLSSLLHFSCAIVLFCANYTLAQQHPEVQYLHWIGFVIFISLLFYQHTLVKNDDLSKVNLAFFTTNGIASLIFGTLMVLDMVI
jgi:4-hydroxybenzoate polyprenyltransferase